jgi:hypothetical protein
MPDSNSGYARRTEPPESGHHQDKDCPEECPSEPAEQAGGHLDGGEADDRNDQPRLVPDP